MFAFLEGELVYKSPSLLHLLAGGIGYEVNITLNTFSKIQDKTKARLFTHLQIREDAWTLYGFAEDQERHTFRLLLGITGVGASTARVLLSSLSSQELMNAVATGNTALLEKVKGIGSKTAQRIILELKGKLSINTSDTISAQQLHNTNEGDALIALTNLGIARNMAENALKKIKDKESLSVEDLIKQALRML